MSSWLLGLEMERLGLGESPGDEPARRRAASTRNPWDDPTFEPGIVGAVRARERARLARLIALVDAQPPEAADLDPCGRCSRPTAYLSPVGICPACTNKVRRANRRRPRLRA
jgi:hypothetical protein